MNQSARTSIDIVYVNYHSGPDLIKSIESLYRVFEGCLSSLQILVADNSFSEVNDDQARSLYKEIEKLRSLGFNILYLPSDSNMGFSRACNKASRLGKSKKIIFANCDTLFDGLSFIELERTLTIIDEENAAIIGPRVISENGLLHASCFSYDPISIALKPLRHVRKIGRLSKAIPQYKSFKHRIDRITYEGMEKDRPCHVDWVSGCFMICSRSFFELAGGFDEQYFLYFEDVDLCRKAKKLGYSVVFDPRLTIMHRAKHASLAQQGIINSIFLNKAARLHLTSWILYMWKWRRDFLHKVQLTLQGISKGQSYSEKGYKLNFSKFDHRKYNEND